MDSDPCQTLESKKVSFLHENILKIGNRSKKCVRTCLFESQEAKVYLLILGNFHAPGSGSAFPNTDPDPGKPNQCGSGQNTHLDDHC